MVNNFKATLKAFSKNEYKKAKIFLATQVAQMMGRKLEEDDWTKVYCMAKGIPYTGWSNLHIDVSYKGLGVEQKILRVSGLRGRPIKSVCGTTMMHPAATRSIRIDDTKQPAEDVMHDIFRQYSDLIDIRTKKVREQAPNKKKTDIRIGWLLWEDSLTEFLYFEQPLEAPQAENYYAEWNETPPKGVRKGSRSLWIYERDTNKKRYSVTTSAGIKIQPYFDVPAPSDENLYYFRVQSEPLNSETIQIWVTSRTAKAIRRIIGNLDKNIVSDMIIKASKFSSTGNIVVSTDEDIAQPIHVTRKAFEIFKSTWEGVSDEHSAQLFLETLHEME